MITQFSSVQLLSHVQLFVTPWTAACQASLSFIISQNLLKLMSIKSMMTSNHFILCCPLLLMPSIFPSIRVFSYKSALCIRYFTIICCCCSVAQSCLTLCDPTDCSIPGFSVLHHLLELVQIHVHWVSGAIQPSHPLLSPSPHALNLSQHQGLFKWVSSSHQVAKVLGLQL